MPLVLCPGIHSPYLTEQFLAALALSEPPLVIPTEVIPVYSPPHVLAFLQSSYPPATSLVLLGFSAGVVGSFGAALGWQAGGGRVQAFIAMDGWGVPLFANFPLYRLSHDHFTHWSCQLLGGSQESFYADPGVPHLELWRSPDQAEGWQLGPSSPTRTTAAEFLRHLLGNYALG